VYLFGQLPFTTVTTEGRTSKAWITANCARLEVLEAKKQESMASAERVGEVIGKT